MAVLAKVANAQGVTMPITNTETLSGVAAGTIAALDAVMYDANGKLVKSDGTKSLGLAYEKAYAGMAVTVIIRGPVEGFDLSAIAPGTVAWAATATAGTLDTTVASLTIAVGKVVTSSERVGTAMKKLFYVGLTNPAA